MHYIILTTKTAGSPSPPSKYGYSNAGVVAYNVACNGSESRIEDCEVSKSLTSPLACGDPASSAAGVVCTVSSMI